MWDVIVVGGGPGGSLTAYELAREGHQVCLIEKEEYPRYKPCGGGLPPHAVDLLKDLNVEVDPYVEHVADQVKFMFDFEDPVISDLSDAPVAMVNRADFDQALMESARDRGASVRDGTAVKDVDVQDEICEVTVDQGKNLKARYVVGADGAGSRVASSVGLNKDSFYGVALDAEVELDQETYQREQQYATFNINFVEKGYAWIFPKDCYLGMGVGGYDNSKRYPDLIQKYIDRSIPEAEIENMDLYGHPLPFYEGDTEVVRGRVGLIGDAANMVDALSGEGIFYSLKAGRLISQCINERLEGNGGDLQNYQREFENTIGKELEMSSKLSKVFFKYPRKCYEHGVKRESIVEMIKDVVRSDAGYGEIYGLIWDEIKKRTSQKMLSYVGLN
ncbi:MAG: NAD(P)/FAD-dependent oxidoreductase [bacterium]